MKLFIALFLLAINILGSMEMSNVRSEKIRRIFNELRSDNTEILDDFYHKEVVFDDPLGRINGLKSMKDYYKNMYKNVIEIRFEFKPDGISENTHYASWIMHLKAEGLNGGETISVPGVSEITFDDNNLVTYHRDHFDMGAFVYEHIPVLGKIIKMIKSKLSGH